MEGIGRGVWYRGGGWAVVGRTLVRVRYVYVYFCACFVYGVVVERVEGVEGFQLVYDVVRVRIRSSFWVFVLFFLRYIVFRVFGVGELYGDVVFDVFFVDMVYISREFVDGYYFI